MKTSQAIKRRQRNPIQPVSRKGDRWTFASESRDRVAYTVERSGREWRCGCPARGLCKHVTAAVIEDAAARGWDLVQVWTDEADARRQKRRTVRMTASGRAFWVTFAWGAWVPRDAEARLVSVRFDKWNDRWDAYYKAPDGRLYRRGVRRAA